MLLTYSCHWAAVTLGYNKTIGMASQIQPLLKEMDQEAQTTRRMLERVPTAYFSWQPHKKSMTVQQLATHIAELPGWVTMAIAADGLDFADNPYQQELISNNNDLMNYFEKTLSDSREQLATAAEDVLDQSWTLRNGADIYHVATKAEIIRMTYSQIVHHRAQLGVFLRLLDIPIPGSYGPSADEHE